MDRNLENVDSFYNKKYAEVSRRLKALTTRYGGANDAPYGDHLDELTDLVGALLEVRNSLRKLQWFGEVNRRGFMKITKKLDKKVPTACVQQTYLTTRVDSRPFANNHILTQDINQVNAWLLVLSASRSTVLERSPPSSAALSRVASTSNDHLPGEILEAMKIAIEKDRAIDLSTYLNGLCDCGDLESSDQTPPHQKLFRSLLQRAIACQSRECMRALLDRIVSLEDDDDLNKRNCIHRLVILIGRNMTTIGVEEAVGAVSWDTRTLITPAEAPNLTGVSCAPYEGPMVSKPDQDNLELQLLDHLLDALSICQRSSIFARDALGRMPLHYAGHSGMAEVCTLLLNRMIPWKISTESLLLDPGWQDLDGNEPLYFSVLGGHPLTTKILLDARKTACDRKELVEPLPLHNSGQLLALATSANFSNIVSLLVQAGADINYQDEQGETALHLASRLNHVDCAKALCQNTLNCTSSSKLRLDVPEKNFGWTPLLVASVNGHASMVNFLLMSGADANRSDLSGWTAVEHAALRGHIEIAMKLSTFRPKRKHEQELRPPLSSLDRKPSSLVDGAADENAKDGSWTQLPNKSFGHRYLVNETCLLVSLGSMNAHKETKPVQLDNIPLAKAHATQLDTALSIVVSVLGATGEPATIDLPVQENISTDPIVFNTKDITKVKLLFDIVPTYAADGHIVGRGVALLSSVKPTIGSKRMNLQGDLSVPLISAKTMDVIGSVNFNFLVITPFTHPNMAITESDTYWKSVKNISASLGPVVIGHRGLGKNLASRKSLQLGENTIQSFIAAANLGASYVEFDVQLTKDHVPVIYHDFLVSETGIDAPVHALTLEQFLHVGDAQSPHPSRPTSPSKRQSENAAGDYRNGRHRHRANSLGVLSDHHPGDMSERMKHTRDFKKQGFKGNSRGNFIQAPFTTLEELLRKLPESIGFNMEMKYPMLFESEEHEMDTYAVELNSFVDSVLTMVYDLGGKRNIIFSSFNPDICLLLSMKQPTMPVLFLTDAGTCPVGDIRASSIQEAIRFASRWNLLGVVAAAEPLVLCPRLVRVIKESGLVCVSYGTLNNDPENVKVSHWVCSRLALNF